MANRLANSRGIGPKMISVMSGKGGVGKSIIAFNLAHRLAVTGHKTLLVDADFSCGNLPVLANVDAASGLDNFVTKTHSLTSAVVTIYAGLDLLGRSGNEPLTGIGTVSEQAALIGRLRIEARRYDFVIIDHSSGISEFAILTAAASDQNLLVLVPELTSISDCYGLLKVLHEKCPQVDCRLVINRAESDDEIEHIRGKFAALTDQFLGTVPALAGAIPEDLAVKKAVAAQQPVAVIDPQALILQRVDAIISNLKGAAIQFAPLEPIPEINNVPALADIKE